MELFYSVSWGAECEYYTSEHKREQWKNAKLYGDDCYGYRISNFGGITKDDENVERYLSSDGEICIKLDGNEVELYKIVASTFLDIPDGGYEDESGRKKHIHHQDNNSFNFNPDNMLFLSHEAHNKKPHLTRENIDDWDSLVNKICKNE
ncbi:MAG TPA: hypothetical protein DEQ14_06005 [Treponema sp.]|nr:hypothetical protein [Treponema sp.]